MASNATSLILSFQQASDLVREHAAALRFSHPRKTESIALSQALGRVLARPVLADRDQPPFHRSTRDGFACRARDTYRLLQVIGQIRAGDPYDSNRPALAEGEAIEIMTGAPVPRGADCVVMIEHVVHDSEAGSIQLAQGRSIQAGENIVRAGAEARRGATVLYAGTRLAPAHLAVAAACGAASLMVYCPPRIAILATGDELVDVEASPLPHQIRNSNSYSLAAQVTSAGAQPMRLPIAKDDPQNIQSYLRQALDSDMLLLSGGASIGKYDFAEEALLALGAEFFFTGALIQPGRPVVFGRLPHAAGPKYFFALPGNPVSTLVTFAVFAHPLLCALAGDDTAVPRFAQAALASTVEVKPGLTRFLPASLSGGIAPEVHALEWHGSGDLASAASANCFLVVPPNRESIDAGETVSVLLS